MIKMCKNGVRTFLTKISIETVAAFASELISWSWLALSSILARVDVTRTTCGKKNEVFKPVWASSEEIEQKCGDCHISA